MPKRSLIGKSGRTYEFDHHNIGKPCPPAPGVFAFFLPTRFDERVASAWYDDAQALHQDHSEAPVWIGRSDDLNADLGGGTLATDTGRKWQELGGPLVFIYASSGGKVGAASAYQDLLGGGGTRTEGVSVE